MTEEVHLTIEQLKERLHLKHRNTLANWRMKGRGPRYVKVGRNVLYPKSAVEAWEQEQMRQNTAQE